MTFILSKDIVNFGSELCSFAMESAAGVVNPELKFIGLMLTLLVIVAIKMVSQNRVRADGILAQLAALVVITFYLKVITIFPSEIGYLQCQRSHDVQQFCWIDGKPAL